MVVVVLSVSFSCCKISQCFMQPPNTWGEIMKVGGTQSPQWEVGAKPLPEAESLVACGHPIETTKLPASLYFVNSIHIGLLCIFDVFRKTITATFEVASM